MAPTGRVLVVGDNDRAGLAIVRSLGRVGLQVHLAKFDSRPVTQYSRYVHQQLDFGHPFRDTERFCSGVTEFVKRAGIDLVIPVTDTAMVPLMAFRDVINQHARFAVPDRLGFETTNDKAHTLEVARRLGVPVPRTFVASTPDDLTHASELANFPLAHYTQSRE